MFGLRGGMEPVMVLMMISSLGLCVLVMANMTELSRRIDYETLANKEYDRVQPNYNQTKVTKVFFFYYRVGSVKINKQRKWVFRIRENLEVSNTNYSVKIK